MKIYFDNAATTMVCDESIKLMTEVMKYNYGNPSSLHTMGMDAENIIKKARQSIAERMGVGSSEIYFTSGGTESDNLAILGGTLRNARKRKTLITTDAEHPAVKMPFKQLKSMGYDIKYLKINGDGIIDLNQLEQLLDDDVAMVSIMQVNNETGCIMPLKEAIKLIRSKSKALIHSDMVQAFGKVGMEDVDLASISSHKIHGPLGVGGLYVKKGIHLNPLMYGGGQQNDLRPGTENVAGIAGFGIAAALADKDKQSDYITALRTRMMQLLEKDIENFVINGKNTVPNIINVSFPGVKSEVLLHSLEAEGIMVSSGSACASNKPAPSPVLTGMGLKQELVDSAIRFSFSKYNQISEIEYCIKVMKKEVPILRKMMN